MPRKVTAAADGRYRVRYHLGIIRRTDPDVNVPNCDLQLDSPALALWRTPQMAAGLTLATSASLAAGRWTAGGLISQKGTIPANLCPI